MENGQKSDNQICFRLEESVYRARLGGHQTFTPLFEASLDTYKEQPERLVFVTDWTVWIQHYLEETSSTSSHTLEVV